MGDLRLWSPTSACLVLLTVLSREAFATGLGKCPIRPPIYGFKVKKMTGKWYEVERSFYVMELAASCIEVEVDLHSRDDILKNHWFIKVTNRNRWTGITSLLRGVGVMPYHGASTFRFRQDNRMPYPLGKYLPGGGQYQVLASDYKNYAIVWACTNYCFAHSDRFWILARKRDIDAQQRAEIYVALQRLKLDPDRLMLSKNSDCETYKPRPFYKRIFG